MAATLSVAEVSDADNDDKTETNFINPIITEETLPDGPGELSLRLGTDYGHVDGTVNGVLPYAEACFGLLERLGATVEVPMAYIKEGAETAYGLGDTSVILKYLVIRPGPIIPAVVLRLESQFPTGNQRLGLGDGAYELNPYLAFLKAFGPLQLQGNVGWSRQVNGSRASACTYNWSGAVPVCQNKLYLLTEINGDWGRPTESAVAPGVKYLFSDKFSVGMAVPIGLNKNTDEWGVVTQFQYDF